MNQNDNQLFVLITIIVFVSVVVVVVFGFNIVNRRIRSVLTTLFVKTLYFIT